MATCAGGWGARRSDGRPGTAGRAWRRRSVASTRTSSPRPPGTFRPRAARDARVRRRLEVRNLRTEFATRAGVVRAVDDVSFSVGAGETVAVVGESGCGKSVTALSIMRLVPGPAGRIAGGVVRFRDRDLLALPEAEMRAVRGREIAMIFQEPMTSLNPTLTGGRQLTEGPEVHLGLDPPAARARAVELLAQVGISDPDRQIGSTRLNSSHRCISYAVFCLEKKISTLVR